MQKFSPDILEYIPQRPPMVMIDRIVDINESKVECQFKVINDNLFVVDGKLIESGIIENIAQTVASVAGYWAKEKNEKVNLGYIAAIKNLNIHALPSVGDVLCTFVEIVNEVFNVTIVHGKVICGNTKIADCEMRIYIADNRK